MKQTKAVPAKLSPEEQLAAVLASLREYVNEYPAFRTKPVGAPDSPARREQARKIAIEDRAVAAIRDVIQK